MRNLVVLLEEPSARDALEVWLPRWHGTELQSHFVVFQGKQDLERQMTRRIRGWLLPDSRFLVMRNQDSGDCRAIKQALHQHCRDAGCGDTVVRVACRELESFFVGDWQAVSEAFGKPSLARLSRSATYRDPDAMGKPSEALARHLPGYQKRDGARRIAPFIDPARNRSRSFHALRNAVINLARG